MILCSHPNCQTTAGCVCNRLDPKAARIAELEAALSAATAERDAARAAELLNTNGIPASLVSHKVAVDFARRAEAAEAEAARLREALAWMRDRDDRNGSLPQAFRDKLDAALEA